MKGIPGNSAGEESACNAGDPGLIPGLGRSPGGRHATNSRILVNQLQENPRRQRSLQCYSPWGHKESDTTEQLSIEEHEAYSQDLLFYPS